MALLHCEFYSKALDMATSARVILPEEGELSQVNVVYLLHGLSDNCTGWTRYTSVERYARARGIAVVMPEVQRSWYSDMALGLNYFRYISEELPQMCHRFFGLSLARERNYVMGLSMGGFGALKTALNFPERYAGVGSFSGAVDLAASVERSKANAQRQREYTAILGENHPIAPENDIKGLLRSAKNPPAVYLSCGEQDSHYDVNTSLAEELERLGVRYRYDHRKGNHTWDFWDQSLQDCFAYFFDE